MKTAYFSIILQYNNVRWKYEIVQTSYLTKLMSNCKDTLLFCSYNESKIEKTELFMAVCIAPHNESHPYCLRPTLLCARIPRYWFPPRYSCGKILNKMSSACLQYQILHLLQNTRGQMIIPNPKTNPSSTLR